MQFTLQTAAQHFDGRQYPFRQSKEEVQALKDSGLLLIYGESDDLIEVCGAIRDEASAYEGGTFWICSEGFLPICENGVLHDAELKTIQDVKKLAQQYDRSIQVSAQWSAGGYSWVISVCGDVVIPHAVFDILEDDEKFCRAIVIQAPCQITSPSASSPQTSP